MNLGQIVFVVLANLIAFSRCQQAEIQARTFMSDLNDKYISMCNSYVEASWAFTTDLENQTAKEHSNKLAVDYATFKSDTSKLVKQHDFSSFKDAFLYRQFRFLKDEDVGALDKNSLEEYQSIKSEMKAIYSTGTVCSYQDPNPNNCKKLSLNPDLEEILRTERDWNKLQYVWEEWRTATGAKMRDMYAKFVELSNAAAKKDGYANAGESWLKAYTVDRKEVELFDPNNQYSLREIDQGDFRTMIDQTWNQVSNSLYKKLHAYVRMKLRKFYGDDKISRTGPIPAHVLGNMWAQQWSNIGDIVNPFPEEPVFDVTDSMLENNWTILKMFQVSENFFKSLGLFEMTDTFWRKSIIDKNEWNKSLVCHASAWDFCKEGDFRIKMCTNINMNDLVTVHHEMGHIEYDMAYNSLPHVFRGSANAGFHEAVGDLIALSVATPNHLTSVLGLSPKESKKNNNMNKNSKYTKEQKRDINFLMSMALDKIAFLPFGYLMDKYRWQLFDGNITADNMNEQWWKLREDIQGVTPPSGPRGEEFFDPGAKYHIPGNTPYVRYFVSYAHQFQFHKHLCSIIGHRGPLHTCDIYQNKKAGAVLRESLELGFSTPWPIVLKKLGGTTVMEASAIEEYFKPLIAFLDDELKGEYIGWERSQNSAHLTSVSGVLVYLNIFIVFLFTCSKMC